MTADSPPWVGRSTTLHPPSIVPSNQSHGMRFFVPIQRQCIQSRESA
jgi:hypothetical protein